MTNNFISTDDFLNSGLPVSDDIRSEEVEFAIGTVEKNYLKPLIGKDLFAQMVADPDSYETLLDETDTTNGIRHAECEMVFAILLFDRFRITRYTAVVKDDEHSKDPSEQEIMNICSLHWEQAVETIIDTLLENGLEPETKIVNQPPFFELSYPVFTKNKGE